MALPTKGRVFQLWEYHVTHGRLLIRSPGVKEGENNLDMIFYGVEFVSLCRFLKEVSVHEASLAKRKAIERALGKEIEPPIRAWVLRHSAGEAFIVGVQMEINENSDEFMKSSFWSTDIDIA